MKTNLPYNGTDYYGFEMNKTDFIVKMVTVQAETAKTSKMSIQFFFIKSGSGKIQINNQEYIVKKGSVLWLFSYHVYHFREIYKRFKQLLLNFL